VSWANFIDKQWLKAVALEDELHPCTRLIITSIIIITDNMVDFYATLFLRSHHDGTFHPALHGLTPCEKNGF